MLHATQLKPGLTSFTITFFLFLCVDVNSLNVDEAIEQYPGYG